MIIAIDWDHTIADSHNLDESGKYPKLLPGAREALEKFREAGHTIMIHSCNRTEWLQECLEHHNLPYDAIWPGKPVAAYYIDDRAIKFTSWEQVLEDMNVEQGVG